MKRFREFLNEKQENNFVDSFINKVLYGNQTKELYEITCKDSEIKNWFIENNQISEIIKSCPSNDSYITKQDLVILKEKMQNVTPDDMSFGRYIEENLAQAFIDFLSAKGIQETMENYFFIDTQTEPLLFYLKDLINRPRPYQLAKYYDIELYPLIHTDACSASYPSGHALSGFVLSEYYARKYPNISNEIKQYGKEIGENREKMGIHYPSDTAISKVISDIIWNNNLLTLT